MHPLLSNKNRFGLYLLAWIPIAALITYLLSSSKRMGWLESAVLSAVLCSAYAFVCLSAWYSCRMVPVQRATIVRLVLTHVLAAAILSLLWIQLARLVAYAMAFLPRFAGIDERVAGQLPVLFVAGFLLYLLSVAYHYVLLAQEASHQAEARVMETSIMARDAELRALRAQINPHFLFNSLNSISALTSIDAARAREMCLLLADFLRATLGMSEKSMIPFSEELALLEKFLAIEKVRFGARLRFEEHVDDDSRRCAIPALLLQPLVENAVAHGIANLPEGGEVRMCSECRDGRLSIRVENSYDPESASSRRGGMGLKNVRQRLDARFGKAATLRVDSENGTFRVELAMPAVFEEKP